MKRLFLVIGLVLGLGVSAGIGVYAAQGDTAGYGYVVTGLDAVALNASAATRTFTITDLPGYGKVHFWLYFDYTATAGQITLTCTGGPSSSDTGYTLTVCDPASATGECTAYNSGILRSVAALSADTKWDAELGISGVSYLSCVGSHGGAPGATDKLTVKYLLVTE